MVNLPKNAPLPTAPKGAAFASVRASFLAALIDRIEAQGRSAQPILNRVGISAAQLSDPYGAIPLPLFVTFLEEAAQMTRDPLLGAQIGAGLKPADMGPVGIILSLSGTIDAGMRRVALYANALQGGTQSQWLPDGDAMVFSYRIADQSIWPRRQDAEFTLSSVTQVIRDNFLSRFAPREVHLEHAPPVDPKPLERLFRAPIRYLQPTNRLIIARVDTARVLRQEDPGLIATLERHVRDLIGDTGSLAHPAAGTSLAARAVIGATLGLSSVSLERIAAALHLGPRTLQRQLAVEGTSLRALLNSVRRERAGHLLSQPGARVGQVAQSLGYGDPTAFWRAYRGWTGESPSKVKMSQDP